MKETTMGSPRSRSIASWILAVVLGLLFLAAAAGKLTGAAAAMFEGWGYAPWFMTLIGVLELLGGIGLLIPKTTRYAILGLTVIMLGAAFTHLTNGEGLAVLRPLIFLGGLWSLWGMRFGRAGS